jgi:hypothetical protein
MSNKLTDKEFSTWQARFALLGQRLTRSNPADGPESYYVTRWGMAKELYTFMELQEFYFKLGGK